MVALKEASKVVSATQPLSQALLQLLMRLCDTSSSASLCVGAATARPSSDVILLKGSASTTRLGRWLSRPAKCEQPQSGRQRRVRPCNCSVTSNADKR